MKRYNVIRNNIKSKSVDKNNEAEGHSTEERHVKIQQFVITTRLFFQMPFGSHITAIGLMSDKFMELFSEFDDVNMPAP